MKAIETTETTLVVVLILAVAAWLWLRKKAGFEWTWDPIHGILEKL